MPEEEYISLLHSSINAISNDIDPFWFVKFGFKTVSSGLKKIFTATSSPAFKWSLGEKKIETRNISKSPPPPPFVKKSPPHPKQTPEHDSSPSVHPPIPPSVSLVPPDCMQIKAARRQLKPGRTKKRDPIEPRVHARTPPLCLYFFPQHTINKPVLSKRSDICLKFFFFLNI